MWSEHATIGEKLELAEVETELEDAGQGGYGACFADKTITDIPKSAEGKDRCCFLDDDQNPCLAPATLHVSGYTEIIGLDRVMTQEDIDEGTDDDNTVAIRLAFCHRCFYRIYGRGENGP